MIHLLNEPFALILIVACHRPAAAAAAAAAADFEVDCVVRMEADECRCVYGYLSRAHKQPDGAARVLTLTSTS